MLSLAAFLTPHPTHPFGLACLWYLAIFPRVAMDGTPLCFTNSMIWIIIGGRHASKTLWKEEIQP